MSHFNIISMVAEKVLSFKNLKSHENIWLPKITKTVLTINKIPNIKVIAIARRRFSSGLRRRKTGLFFSKLDIKAISPLLEK